MREETANGISRVRRLRADARVNHDRLLAAASAVFTESGPEASLEEIARQAGVGIGTLYRHFPTREALMGAVVREKIFELADEARHALDGEDPGSALAGWLGAYLAFSATKRGLLAGVVLLKERGDSEFQTACNRMCAALEALVARAQVSGQVRADVVARDVMHLISAIAVSAEHASDPEMAGRLLTLTLNGLRDGTRAAGTG